LETTIDCIGLTLVLSVLIISALVLVLSGGKLATHIALTYGFDDLFSMTWKVVQWPLCLDLCCWRLP
jgi:hypothetical protein